MRVFVSGTTYFAALDPLGTDFHREHPEVPEPDLVKAGRGYRADYGELDGRPLFALLDRLGYMAEGFSGRGVDQDTRLNGSAIGRDWKRLMLAAEPQKPGYYTGREGDGWYRGAGESLFRWTYMSRITRSGRRLPAGEEGSSTRHWLDIGGNGPFGFVCEQWPDESWRKCDS